MDLSMRRRIILIAILSMLFPRAYLRPQDKKSGNSQEKLIFRLPVDVIVIHASAVDKQGNPATDLTRADFKLYVDGKPQEIQTFALESYEPAPVERKPGIKRAADESKESAPNATRPRMISMVVDDLTSAAEYFPSVIKAMIKFVDEDMRPEDQVAVLAASGRALFPFTDNKPTLREELNGLSGKLSRDRGVLSECPRLTDLQAKRIVEGRGSEGPQDLSNLMQISNIDLQVAVADVIVCANLTAISANGKVDANVLGQARSLARNASLTQYEESEYRTRMLLNTLGQHLRTLRHFDAVKSLILFSDGFLSGGGSHNTFDLQEVVDRALASGVVLNTVDIRGLYTDMVPASERVQAASSDLLNYQFETLRNNASEQESPLYQMANDTGGMFHHNNNDLQAGVRAIVHRQSSYYVMTFSAPQQESDGRYHPIKLEVSRGGLDLAYRKGYYAPREEQTFERRKREDIVEALQAPGNLNEVPVELAYNYYQDDESKYVVSLSTNVNIRGLHFLNEDSRRKNLVHMVVAAFDETDRFLDGIEKSVDLRLKEDSYTGLLNRGLNSRVEFRLAPGRYKIKAVVRESAGGKMGSATRIVEIP
jgi:VWFA-related protein